MSARGGGRLRERHVRRAPGCGARSQDLSLSLMCAQDRLATLEAVRAAGISVCAGGIIGLGEGAADRVGLLLQLATLRAHPESVPINALARRPGLTRPPTLALTIRAPGAARSPRGACVQGAAHAGTGWGALRGEARVVRTTRECAVVPSGVGRSGLKQGRGASQILRRADAGAGGGGALLGGGRRRAEAGQGL